MGCWIIINIRSYVLYPIWHSRCKLLCGIDHLHVVNGAFVCSLCHEVCNGNILNTSMIEI